MSDKKVPNLDDLIGDCLVVKFSNGDQVAGFLEEFDDEMLTLFVSGEFVFIPLFNVLTITKAKDFAC